MSLLFGKDAERRNLDFDFMAARMRELKARREIMAWAVDKLRKWEALLPEADRPTCREIRHALSETNPKLRGV